MGTRVSPNMPATGECRKRLRLPVLAFLLAVLLPAHAVADNSALYRSLLLPGAGQAHKGHYKKATIFAGVTVLTSMGLLVTQIQYNQAADRYNNEKRVYNAYQKQLQNDQIVNIEDMNTTYSSMQSAWNDADGRIVWRNVFLTTLIATYVVNLVDVLVSDPYDVDAELQKGSRYSIESDGRGVRFAATFGF